MTKNRWIVSPNILEINTDETIIRGFYISRFKKDYNDYLLKFSDYSMNRYTYIVDNVDIPNDPDAVYGYYSLKGNKIYYRKQIGPLSLRFSYDIKNNIMTVGYLESKIPFEIGHIWPSGLYLSNIISLDLLINNGILIMEGAAVKIKDKTYLIMGPSTVGKSTIMNYLINKKNGKYIGEDKFLTNGKDVFMVPPINYRNFSVKTLEDSTIGSSNIDSLIFLTKRKFPINDIDTLLNINSLRLFSHLDDSFVKVLQFFGIYCRKTISDKKNEIINHLMDKEINLFTMNHEENISSNISKIFGKR